MSSIRSLLLVLLAVAASSAAGIAGNKLKHKHIHLYMHETFSGANATEGAILPSPFGANAKFGSVAVFDDELRTGLSRDSPLVARYQGIIVATGVAEGPASQGHLTVASILFVAGEYAGSVLSLEGPFVGFQGTLERSIVGGNGKFRMARGYYLLKLLNLTSPLTAVSEADFYVLTCHQSYM
ncbi:hypothetical protein ACQ4PT_004453 [Festuca glaucescens]